MAQNPATKRWPVHAFGSRCGRFSHGALYPGRQSFAPPKAKRDGGCSCEHQKDPSSLVKVCHYPSTRRAPATAKPHDSRPYPGMQWEKTPRLHEQECVQSEPCHPLFGSTLHRRRTRSLNRHSARTINASLVLPVCGQSFAVLPLSCHRGFNHWNLCIRFNFFASLNTSSAFPPQRPPLAKRRIRLATEAFHRHSLPRPLYYHFSPLPSQ